MQERHVHRTSSRDNFKVSVSFNNQNQPNSPPRSPPPEPDEEQLRTLWVGGISQEADDQILYELFQNAGPLERVTIPKDKETKKQKSFAFVVFQHEESVKYAYDLLSGVCLFGSNLRLQNKETGLGIDCGRGRGRGTGPRNHPRSNTMPNLRDMERGRRDDIVAENRGFDMQSMFHTQESMGDRMMRQQSMDQHQVHFGQMNYGGGMRQNFLGHVRHSGGQWDRGMEERYDRDGRNRDRDRSYDGRQRDYDRHARRRDR